jgi:hypothetical protein
MSRSLATANLNAVIDDTVYPVLFFEADFSSGFIRCHNLIGTITWNGYDWLGVGVLGGISAIEETGELGRKTVTYTLTGLPNDLISVVLGEQYQGRAANLYIGFLDKVTGVLVSNPYLLDKGRMDTTAIEEGDTLSITLTVENVMSAWQRPQIRRYNNIAQQARFPNDLGLEFVSQAANKEIFWGRKSV